MDHTPALIRNNYVYIQVPGTMQILKQRVKQRKNVGSVSQSNEPTAFQIDIIRAIQSHEGAPLPSQDLRTLTKRYRISRQNFEDFAQASFTRALSELLYWNVVEIALVLHGKPQYRLNDTRADQVLQKRSFI